MDKWTFGTGYVEISRHIFSADGVKTDPKNVEDVRDDPAPHDRTYTSRFVGLAGYYRRLIRDFTGIYAPLHSEALTKKKLDWTEESQESFEMIKTALTYVTLLAFPEVDSQFLVENIPLLYRRPQCSFRSEAK